jgi:hypothetical protein
MKSIRIRKNSQSEKIARKVMYRKVMSRKGKSRKVMSRKEKSRKVMSRKGKSRKVMSRKGKSRKEKSRKGKSRKKVSKFNISDIDIPIYNSNIDNMSFSELVNEIYQNSDFRIYFQEVVKVYSIHGRDVNEQNLRDFFRLRLTLNSLYIVNCNIRDLEGLENLPNLSELFIQNCITVDNQDLLNGLEGLRKLKSLTISQNPFTLRQPVSIEPIGRLHNLEYLNIYDTGILNLSPLHYLDKLKSLTLSGTGIDNISYIKNLVNLTQLDLANNDKLINIGKLNRLINLQYLDISNTSVSNISPIRNLSHLTELVLSDTYVENISPVRNLSHLTYLDISNTNVRDVKPLFNLTNLEFLNVSEDINETDLRVIEENNDGINISQY